MGRTSSAILLAVVAVCADGCRRERVPTRAPRCLTIVAWNDLHGQLEADRPMLDTGRVPAGGVIALADRIAAVRADSDAVFLLDAGDLFTGPLESTTTEGAPVIAAYNLLRVDAVAIGNHEFDFGPSGAERVIAPPGTTDDALDDGPRGALLMRMREAHFPFLSANLRTTGGGAPRWQNLESETIIARGGFKVGVVGYTTLETPQTTLPPNVAGVEFTPGAPPVAAAIRRLRALGAAPVVLLAHASLDGPLPQSLDGDSEPSGQWKGELATLVSELSDDLPDVIIAGHRHAWMLGRIRGVPVVSSDQHGVGYARIRFCRAADRMAFSGIERELAFASSPPATALGREVAAAVKPFADRVRDAAAEVITVNPRTCYPDDPVGTRLVEHVAYSMKTAATEAGLVVPGTATVAIMNTGGVRAPLLAGAVTMRDLFAALPFENAVATCTTTKTGLTTALSNLVSKNTAPDSFPFGISGARVRLHAMAGLPVAVTDVALDVPAGRVTIIIPDFLLYGGDGFLDGVACTTAHISATRIRDAYRATLARADGACDGPPLNVSVATR